LLGDSFCLSLRHSGDTDLHQPHQRNQLKSVFDVIQSLRATNSNKVKLEILSANKANEDLKQFLKITYEPKINFYMTKVDPNFAGIVTSLDQPFTDDTLAEVYDTIATRELTGHAAKSWVATLWASLDSVGQELLRLLIQRDAQAGVSVSTINKVWPGLLTDVPYMRCCLPKESDLVTWPWAKGIFSQIKADGMFANVNNWGERITIETRAGTPMPLDFFQDLITEVQKKVPTGYQLHGELLMLNPQGEVMKRAEGNGMFNRLLKEGVLEDGYTPMYQVWDMIPIGEARVKNTYSIPYRLRFEQVLKMFGSFLEGKFFRPIEFKLVFSLAEAYAHAKEAMQKGLEGTVIKHPEAVWEDSTSKYQVKLKLEYPVDLLVVGFNAANEKSKNSDTFGSLECWSADGKLRVGVTGLKDHVRKDLYDRRDTIIGKLVITVKSNGIQAPSEDTNGYYSLFLPRFVEERLDKTTADTLEEIQAQQEAAINSATL
jgi:DNA ligase 1